MKPSQPYIPGDGPLNRIYPLKYPRPWPRIIDSFSISNSKPIDMQSTCRK